MKTIRRWLAVFLVIPMLAAGFGCASNPGEAKADPADEYVFIRVTGSNIPKRIKKSDILRGDLPKDGDAQMVDKEQFLKTLGPGKKIERGS